MNHTEVKHSFSRSLAGLAGLALIAGLAGGCIAPAADADRQADPDHAEGVSDESTGVATETKPAEEREHTVDVNRGVDRETATTDGVNDTVAPAHVNADGTEADDSTSENPDSLVAAASSPTDTPQPSPWKGHTPPPIGPGNGPPTSDTASSQ